MNNLEALPYAKAIVSADWYYNMTEDYGAYNRGRASVENVRKMIESKNWTIDEVEMIKLECRNQLLLRQNVTELSEKTTNFWNTKVDQLFKKALEQ